MAREVTNRSTVPLVFLLGPFKATAISIKVGLGHSGDTPRLAPHQHIRCVVDTFQCVVWRVCVTGTSVCKQERVYGQQELW